jgi:hypothetical protein
MMKKLHVVKSKLNNSKMIYRLKISLDGSKPEIWRRVLVPGKFSLEKLHFIIQIVMGWNNTHLHEFEISSKRYINPDHDPDEMDSSSPAFDEKKVKIADVLSKKDCLKYSYDFGDDWNHSIIVEDIEEPSDIFNYPLCTDGANACPPEDCGGIHGYYNLLENLKRKDSEAYFDLMTWVGGQFNPSSFDANRVNRDGLWTRRW